MQDNERGNRQALLVIRGRLVRAHREDAGLTVSQLATAVGIDKAYLSRIERGERGTRGVNADTAQRLADALGLPLHVLTAANVSSGDAA